MVYREMYDEMNNLLDHPYFLAPACQSSTVAQQNLCCLNSTKVNGEEDHEILIIHKNKSQ